MSRVTAISAGTEVAPEKPDSATEARLLERFIESRDEAAFEALVRAHGPMVYGVCLRMLGNHADADDAFQATFLILARKAASIAHRGMPANWLFQVAHRSALKVRFAIGKRRQREKSMNALPEPAAPRESDWAELAPVLDEAVYSLPHKYQVAVVLCDLEGKTRKEAARQLGWAEGTLGTRLTKAREILAGRLSRRGIIVSAGTLALFLSQNALSAAVPAGLVATTAHTAVAAVSLPATSLSAFATKGAAVTKGVAKAAPLTKGIAAVVFAGLVATAGVAIHETQTEPPKPAPPAFVAGSIPPEIQQALEENVRQLSPISISYTSSVVVPPGASGFGVIGGPANLTDAERSRLSNTADRAVWQDHCLYLSSTRPAQGVDGKDATFWTEVSCRDDVLFRRFVHRPEGPVNLLKMRLDQKGTRNLNLWQTHFGTGAFVSLNWDSGENVLQMESEILAALKANGAILALEEVVLEGRRHVRITLETDNFVRAQAAAMLLKIEESDRRTPPPPEQVRQRQPMLLQFEARRNAPAKRRIVYDLDPAMNYAVRNCEHSYGADTLLRRTECRDFEQVPGRSLWLPRHAELRSYESPINAEVSKDVLATQIMDVKEWDFSPVPAEQFTLNDMTPGTIVFDGTLPEAMDSPRQGVVYVVPQRAEDLDGVIATARNEANRPTVEGNFVLNSVRQGPAGPAPVPSGTGPQAQESANGRPLSWSSPAGSPVAAIGLETTDAPTGTEPRSFDPIRILIAFNGALLLAALGYVLIRRWRAR